MKVITIFEPTNLEELRATAEVISEFKDKFDFAGMAPSISDICEGAHCQDKGEECGPGPDNHEAECIRKSIERLEDEYSKPCKSGLEAAVNDITGEKNYRIPRPTEEPLNSAPCSYEEKHVRKADSVPDTQEESEKIKEVSDEDFWDAYRKMQIEAKRRNNLRAVSMAGTPCQDQAPTE